MKINKFYILLLTFLITLFASVGAASWIIISNPQLNDTANTRGDITIDPNVQVSTTAVYEGQIINASADVPGTFYYNGNKIGEIADSATTITKEVDLTAPTNVSGKLTNNYLTPTITFEPLTKEESNYLKNNHYTTPNTAVTKTVNIKPVAYNANSRNTAQTYYSSVEYALNPNQQNSSYPNIFVMPYTVGEDKALSELARTIKSDCTINSGISLILPYSGTTYSNYTPGRLLQSSLFGASEGSTYNTTTKFVTDITTHSVNAYFLNTLPDFNVNNVIIDEYTTLTNNGTINVGGQMSGGGGGYAYYNSCTVKEFAQLTLKSNAILDCSSGSQVNCYGYIAEELENGQTSKQGNGSSVILNNGADLRIPFTILEHRGGSNLSDLQNAPVLPITRYTMPNVTSKIVVRYGSSILGAAMLCASSTAAGTDVLAIGSDETFFVQLFEGCTLESKFDPISKVTDWVFDGKASINKFEISIDITIANMSMTTQGKYMPISWYYNIRLLSGSVLSAEGQDIQILPGGNITIDEGATFKAKNIAVYETFDLKCSGDLGVNLPYENAKGNNIDELVVNGTLIAEGVSGIVHTTSNTGVLNVKNYSSLSVNEITSNASPYVTAYNYDLALNIYDGATVNTTATNASTGEYKAVKDSNNNYGWAQENVVNITYNENGGSTVSDITNKTYSGTNYYLTANDLPTPTREYYTFSHWELNGTRVNVGTPVTGNVTLTAVWTPIEYTLNYYYVFNGAIDTSKVPTLPTSHTFTVESTNTVFDLDDILYEEGKYTFGGWYLSNTTLNNSSEIGSSTTGADILAIVKNLGLTIPANNVITVYAQLAEEKTYTISVTSIYNSTAVQNSAFGAWTYTDGVYTKTALESLVDEFELPDFTSTNSSTNYMYYNAVWTYSDGTSFTITNNIANLSTAKASTDGVIELTVTWSKKNVLSFNTTTNLDATVTGITVPNSVYLLDNQEYKSLPDISGDYENDLKVKQYFGGWLKDGALVTAVSITDDTEIVANWVSKYIVNIDTATNSGNIPADYLKVDEDKNNIIYLQPNQTYNLPTLDNYDYDASINRSYGGWSADSNSNIANNVLSINSGVATGTTITVTANWANKCNVTIGTQPSKCNGLSISFANDHTGLPSSYFGATIHIKSGEKISVTANAVLNGGLIRYYESIQLSVGNSTDRNNHGTWGASSATAYVNDYSVTSDINITVTNR